jgi:hypothetical protein
MEYHIIETNHYSFSFIAHKSCKYDGKRFSNAKFLLIQHKHLMEERCNLVDVLLNTFSIPILYLYCENKHEIGCEVFIYLSSTVGHDISIICVCIKNKGEKSFNTFDALYDYIHTNYPHLIINQDIKIALK